MQPKADLNRRVERGRTEYGVVGWVSQDGFHFFLCRSESSGIGFLLLLQRTALFLCQTVGMVHRQVGSSFCSPSFQYIVHGKHSIVDGSDDAHRVAPVLFLCGLVRKVDVLYTNIQLLSFRQVAGGRTADQPDSHGEKHCGRQKEVS